MVLLKQYTDTNKDSHDATKHNSERTLVCSFQQHLAQFHSQFVAQDLCLQDSQCDPTEERHSNICLALRMHQPCACLVNQFFTVIPDHEVSAAKLTNRWISGCWWKRDALSDQHLVGANFGPLLCRSGRRKSHGKQWSRRETV